jgi:hypothetical protein
MKFVGRMYYGLVVSVCPHNSAREPLDGLGWNLVCVLCHSGLPQTRIFEYPVIGDNKMTRVESREVDGLQASEVVHSDGQSGKYRSSNLFVYSGYRGYPG